MIASTYMYVCLVKYVSLAVLQYPDTPWLFCGTRTLLSCSVVFVHQLETENSQMKEENVLLRHQVDVLRSRLHALPLPAAREIHRVSVEVSRRAYV